MLKGGSFSQNGGEFIFEQGECIWANRMQNTRDHAELADLQRVLKSPEERAPRREKWSSGIVRSLSNRARRQSWDPSSKRQSWSEKRTSRDLGDSRERSASNHYNNNNKRHSWYLWSSASGKGFDDRDSSPEPMEVMPEDHKGEAYEESLENSRKSQQQEEENSKETTSSNSGNEAALKALNRNSTVRGDSTPSEEVQRPSGTPLDNNDNNSSSDDKEGDDAAKLQQPQQQEKKDEANEDTALLENVPTPHEPPSSATVVS